MTPARALLLAALIALPISVGLTYLPFWSIGHFRLKRILARMRLIRQLDQSGDNDAARAEAEAWEQSTRPNDPVARVNIARVWRMLGDPEHALRILQATPILHVPHEYTCCTRGGSTSQGRRAFVESADPVVRQFIDGRADGPLPVW
jgi:hypothetical protein